MRSRTIALIVLAIFALAATCFAQAQKRPAAGKAGHAFATRIVEELGLSTEQTQQIKQLVTGARTEARGIAKSDLPKEEKQAQFKALRQTTIDRVMAVLTPAQQAKAREMGLVDMIMNPRKGMETRFARIAEKLDLTESQKSTIRGIVEASMADARAIKGDTTLTPEQRKAKFVEIKRESFQQVMSVLTPEQQQKAKEMMKNCRQPRAKVGR